MSIKQKKILDVIGRTYRKQNKMEYEGKVIGRTYRKQNKMANVDKAKQDVG
jgi:hypothetical protein